MEQAIDPPADSEVFNVTELLKQAAKGFGESLGGSGKTS